MREFLQFLVLFAIYSSGAIVGVIVMALVSAGAQADRCAECQERQTRREVLIMAEWIPVTERLPDYSGRFLVIAEVDEGFAKGHKSIEIARKWSDDIWVISDVSIKFRVTHWMPLPDPPEGGADG